MGWRRGRRIFSRSKHVDFPADVGRKSARKSILGVDMILFTTEGGSDGPRIMEKKKIFLKRMKLYRLLLFHSI